MITKLPMKSAVVSSRARLSLAVSESEPAPHWQVALPDLANDLVTLREVCRADAPALCATLSTAEVRRYMSPPPGDIPGFERFVEWAQSERRAGRLMCFAVVPANSTTAIGLFQVRQVDPEFTVGEWGAALGSQFWGTGLFTSAAELLFDFLFDHVGLRRLEARAAVRNGRANGAARKMGSVPEGVIRQGLSCGGHLFDQLMWSLLAEDWQQSKADDHPVVH